MTYSNNTPPHIKAGIPAPKDLTSNTAANAAAIYPALPTPSRAQRSLMAMLWIWVCRMNRAFETGRAAGHRRPTASFKFTLFMIGLILRLLPGTAAEKQALFQHMVSRHRQDRRVKRQRIHKICLRRQARRLWTLMLRAASGRLCCPQRALYTHLCAEYAPQVRIPVMTRAQNRAKTAGHLTP